MMRGRRPSATRNAAARPQPLIGQWACYSARGRPMRWLPVIFGKMVSARGIAPACVLLLVEINAVLGKLNTVDLDRFYDTERYHFKAIGM